MKLVKIIFNPGIGLLRSHTDTSTNSATYITVTGDNWNLLDEKQNPLYFEGMINVSSYLMSKQTSNKFHFLSKTIDYINVMNIIIEQEKKGVVQNELSK